MHILRTLAVLLVSALGLAGVLAAPPELATDDDKVLYTLGFVMARDLSRFDFTEAQLATIQSGLTDGALVREPRVALKDYSPLVDRFLESRAVEVLKIAKDAGRAHRMKAAEEPGAEMTDSGLIYLELEAGTGASPAETDSVKIHYHGTLPDGSVFDSSREKDPVEFNLGGVIGCFREGIAKMKVGGKSKLTCPPEIAYGDRGSPPKIRGGSTLVFEVQLLEIVDAP